MANVTLFGYLFHRYRYNMEVDEEKIDTVETRNNANTRVRLQLILFSKDIGAF